MKKWFDEKIFSNNKKTLLFLGGSAFVILAIYQLILILNGTYFNSNSDDVAQYSIILSQYIKNFKEGTLSWYNFGNNFGASSLADIYYVPLDIFSLLTLLLSCLINPLLAFSCVELMKVVLGVVAFSFFLQKCKFKNKLVAFVAFIYFCCGGGWCFVVYPTYFSLFFYLPVCLLVIRWYIEGKKWILPLYSVLLIFYNFYNAYSLFVFMVIVYVIELVKDNYKGFSHLVKDVICFGLHIVLGVVMGLVVLLPSIMYILNYSNRDMSNFDLLFDFEIYMQMLYRFFVYESGVNNMNVASDTIGTYYNRHFGYYMGFLCLYLVALLFVMKDRVSKTYKCSIIVFSIMMCIPIFSMIFSGVAVAYTRWFTFVNIILLYYVAYVLSVIDTVCIKEYSKRKVCAVIFGLYSVVFIYNMVRMIQGIKSGETYFAYSLTMLVLFGMIGVLYVLFYFAKQKSLMYSVVVVEMLIALIINFYVPFSSDKLLKAYSKYERLNSVIDKLDVDKDELSRIYINRDSFNSNRMTDYYTNEITFHSFLTKYVGDYFNLYSKSDSIGLVISDLNTFSPYFSRIMDYKYLILDKTQKEFYMDYMDIVYEDDSFVVYENKGYSPFYVYESYYSEEQVIQNNENGNLLMFMKNLFKGVVLNDDYGLEQLEFNYTENDLKYLNMVSNVELIKEDNYYVQYLNMDLDYEGVVYIKGDELSKINELKIVSSDDEKECYFDQGVYACSFNGKFEKIIYRMDDYEGDLEYYVLVTEANKLYAWSSIDNYFENEYIVYNEENAERDNIILIDNDGDRRLCYKGICILNEFDEHHILIPSNLDMFLNDEEIHLVYENDDLSYYNENKFDINARNKSLTKDGSTIKVQYERITETDNNQVIVLPITYSEEWICDSEDYDLIKVNGGFLGVVVKKGIKNIDVSIKFKPTGVKIGMVGTFAGIGIYAAYIVFIYCRKKRNEKNENI